MGTWLREVENLLQNTTKPLIIVGGTGLYFQALLHGLTDIPPIKEETRNALAKQWEEEGLSALQDRLRMVDSEITKRLDMNNPRRVLRALEVYEETGTPLSVFQAQTPPPLLRREYVRAYALVPPVEITNARIATRFDKMIKLGALDEVRQQMNPWQAELPANQALGAKELAAYLHGETSLEEAISSAVISTRQYAKRQRSWFRSKMKDWIWIDKAAIRDVS